MEYRITIKNQLRALDFLIFGSLLYIGVVCFYLGGYDVNADIAFTDTAFKTDIILFLLIYYLVLLIPTLFLHIEYYSINKNDIVTINTVERNISFNSKERVSFDKIEKIILVLTPVMYRNGSIRFLPSDNYHYAVIKMKAGEQIIFTSLMAFRVENVMKELSGVPLERKSRLLASPTLFRYWTAFWS